jgi:hypothetical protein
MLSNTKTKVICLLLFIGACVLLHYGSGMLFLVPSDPGESYIKSLFAGRFLFGVVPTLSSAVLLVVVGRLWDRSNGSVNHKETIATTFSLAVAATVFGWIGVMIVGGILDRFK